MKRYILSSILLYSSLVACAVNANNSNKKYFDINTKDNQGNTALHLATKAGNEKLITVLIDRKANLEARDANNQTPLHIAIKTGRIEIVNALLNALADLNAQDYEGNTPLHTAITLNNNALIKTLIQAGAFLHIKNKEGKTPLLHAAALGRKDLVVKLLRIGANITDNDNSGKSTIDYFNIFFGSEQTQKLLKNFTENIINPPTQCPTDLQKTILHFDQKTFQQLIATKVDINETDNHGWTALHYAVLSNNINALATLLNMGAHIDIQNRLGETPLHIATGLNQEKAATILLAAKADTTLKNHEGNSPLHIAAFWGWSAIATILLKSGADINLQNNEGLTPLDIASDNQCSIYTGRKDVEILLKTWAKDHGILTNLSWSQYLKSFIPSWLVGGNNKSCEE